MKFNITQLNYFNGCLTLPIPKPKIQLLEGLKRALESGKIIEVDIDIKREKRSNNANAYLWALLGKMADVLNTNKDDLYIAMLERYGVFTHMIVKPRVVSRVKQEWRAVRELGPVTINGQQGIQLQCYFGSHIYNSKEFSVLLNGVIEEAKDLGIETKSEEEINSLIREWGGKDA